MTAVSAVYVKEKLPARPQSSAASCRLPTVESPPKADVRMQILKLRQRVKRSNTTNSVSINEIPMMLLPKARVRTTYDVTRLGRDLIIPDHDYSALHLSTLHPHTELTAAKGQGRSRYIGRSRPVSRSDVDSGIGSLKRGVTFDDLSVSRSTVFKSLEELESTSEDELDHKMLALIENDTDSVISLPAISPRETTKKTPEYLESYGNKDDSFLPEPPQKKIKRKRFLDSWRSRRRSKIRYCDVETCSEQDCSICEGFMSDKERITRTFGGVDNFLDWLFSKWGKVRFLVMALLKGW